MPEELARTSRVRGSLRTTPMRRRTLLMLPAVAAVLAACSEDRQVSDKKPTKGKRKVAYGDDPSQYGELTLPDSEPRGVAVLVHGGFWKPEYGIEYATPMVPSLVEAGWATWAIEYRRGTGAADTVSMVMRQTIRQLSTPDELRGRMTSVNMIFYVGGPQLGELEAGFAAALIGLAPSIILGGFGVICATAAIGALVPALRNYKGET